MNKGSNLAVVDTNVPIVANYATNSANIPKDLPTQCILACVKTIEKVIKTRSLVIDSGDEIFSEYRNNLNLQGQPGVGDRFMRWVHDNRYKFSEANRVPITKEGESYVQFPKHTNLKHFDSSDRKFVAVSNAHPDKPPIYQATDSKWWGWKGALSAEGIHVHFLCKSYVKKKYREKIGT